MNAVKTAGLPDRPHPQGSSLLGAAAVQLVVSVIDLLVPVVLATFVGR
ncbi:MAG TPA: hypothetical protein VE261_00355 [Gaiellaceae bacterium]|nr:hypothetical protein [Gaiellaceae bacterium]